MIIHGSASCGFAQQLGDPGFEALSGKAVTRAATPGEWSIPPGAPYADGIEIKPEPASARSGQCGLKLAVSSWGRMAAVHQTIPQLAAGLYEFKVWAKGAGVLILRHGLRRRRGNLTNAWTEYSLTFAQAQAGPAELAILTDKQAQADDASLTAASPERVAAWRKQEQARTEYGFIPPYFSAQLPQPGAPVIPAGEFHAGPVTWREKVVFYDPTYDAAWSIHPETLARYLGANGFRILGAAALGEWMQKATRAGAYGTVCVMTHGLCPGSVYSDDLQNSVIHQYLNAGGRVVWVGEVPFFYLQDDVHPRIFSLSANYIPDAATEMLDIRGCPGNTGPPIVTDLGKAWGLGNAGDSSMAVYAEDVTAVLSGFYADYPDATLAVDYLKTINPLDPWSGLIYGYRGADFNVPANQESVYRLALYTGKPVEAPPGITVPAPAVPPLQVLLDAPRDRRNFYRGETIPVKLEATSKTAAVGKMVIGQARVVDSGSRGRSPSRRRWRASVPASRSLIAPPKTEGLRNMTVFLERGGRQYGAVETALPSTGHPAQVNVNTSELACGDYRLRVLPAGAEGKSVLWEAVISLCPRHDDPTFFMTATAAVAGIPYRQEMLAKDVAAHGMQGVLVAFDAQDTTLDPLMKYGLRFCMRAHGRPTLTDTEHEQAERCEPNGQKVPGAWENGRPILGLLSARLRATDAADMALQVKKLAAWPSAWPRCQTGDDFALKYGWDYSELAKRTFKAQTGLDAPVPPELAKTSVRFPGPGAIAHPPGIIPDDDPWLQWSVFTTRDIGGGYNRALTDACLAAVPGIKVGPIPGSMMFPLMEEGQYPPHDFGRGGFNLIYYYMYLNYWEPTIANLYWNEVGRINNRDLELWAEPDAACQPSPSYYRNTFFLQVAGGAQGLTYFPYGPHTQVAYETLGQIANRVVKPLDPFLGKLRPARTSVGLLLPYTQYCYQSLYAVSAVFPFANLLAAHVDVQPTCEEEVLSGDADRYQVILLWRVQYLRQSVVTALEDYIARGGVVISDAGTQVPIKGAIKSSVDLAMGGGKSNPDPNDPRFGGPGITDYLKPEVVAAVRHGLAPYTKPWADCADPTLIVRRHEYRGVTYLWLVNIESREDYDYVGVRPRVGKTAANPKQADREAYQYLAEQVEGKRFTPQVTIPAGHWAAYDVIQGRRVPLQQAGDRLVFTADMERLGGTLIALYPEPVKRVTCQLPRRTERGQAIELRVTVRGPSGNPLAGTQPLAVTVTTPIGEWAEITGAHATDDGVWSATIDPAINDPPGVWRVRVKELASGVVGATSVTVH